MYRRNVLLLRDFKVRNGHLRVPENYVVDRVKLGLWVGNTRRRTDKLSAAQKHELESLGFSWDPYQEVFDAHFSAYVDFLQVHGHQRMSNTFIYNGLKVGAWAHAVRARHAQGRLRVEHVALLKSIGFVWNLREDLFESNFKLLEEFVARERHCRVPQNHVERGVRLGGWVSALRLRYKNGQLSAARIAQLNSLKMIWVLDGKDRYLPIKKLET